MPLGIAQQDLLWATQRKMLRSIVGWRYRAGDAWDDVMRGMKHRVDNAMQHFWVEPWSARLRRSIWRYAVHLSNMAEKSLLRLVTNFIPVAGKRRVGRPYLRWYDILSKFCVSHFRTGSWLEMVKQHPSLEEQFVEFEY